MSGPVSKNSLDHSQASERAPVFDEGFCAPERRVYVLWATILASAMGFIDGSVVPIALPSIRASLDTSLAQAQWFSTAYFLTLASFNLIAGALGDRFGLGRTLRFGLIFFVVASLGCAFATSSSMLIGMRAIQGLGAAVLSAASLAALSRAYPREERGAAIGLWAAASAVATAIGPIAGGLALTYGDEEVWRWIFAINLPFGIVALVLLARAGVAVMPDATTRLDWTGATLVTLALLLLTWGLGAEADAGEIDLRYIVLAIVFLCIFVWQQGRAEAPIMPLRLFGNPVFTVANIYTLIFYGTITAVFFFLPVILIDVWQEPEINVSAIFAPLAIFIGGLSGRVGRWSDRFGPKPLLVGGATLLALGCLGLAYAAPSYNLWGRILPAMALIGLGMALTVGPISATVMTSIDDDLTGTASGANNTVSRIGGMLAIAGFSTIATLVYLNAGGPEAFGAATDASEHVAASFVTFQWICYSAAALAMTAVITALFGLKR